MCARRFLGCVFVLILLFVAAGFAIYQWGGDVLLKQAVPKGHFQAAKAGSGPDYAKFGKLDRADPDWPTIPRIGCPRA